jgi:predicted DNA binding protein
MTRTIYGVYVSTDERSGKLLNDFFERQEDASAIAKGAGWYGSNGDVMAMTLHSDIHSYRQAQAEAKLTAAKNKLTDSELEVLREALKAGKL